MMADSICDKKPHPKVELTPQITKGQTLPFHTETPSSADEPKHRPVYTNKGTTEKSEKTEERKGTPTFEIESKMASLPASALD